MLYLVLGMCSAMFGGTGGYGECTLFLDLRWGCGGDRTYRLLIQAIFDY
jgi:hypothetical protein